MQRAQGFEDDAGNHYATAKEAIDADFSIAVVEFLNDTNLSCTEEQALATLLENGEKRSSLLRLIDNYNRALIEYTYDARTDMSIMI